ncbi:MFS transporter [Flexivirga oryzae]|uniref:Putative MFS family arabinose efflux permease n=1 Tax=Flexivirga oryzae TaxID=1794944 RepID=A0A839MYI4_9MICO|nr:putative MFS family arabinose efflux permease [Flexivirga oryzae]
MTARTILQPPVDLGYRRGDAGYRRITAALFAAGMTTFVAMYCAQAVLPAISADFAVSPAGSALTVSATTGLLALAIIPASALSERFGRTTVMTVSAVASALIGLVLPLSPSMAVLVLLRALQGVALAGVPATAMAYLAEEVDRRHLGAAMGRYIAGTTIGGLAGRLVASFTLDLGTWRWALEAAALVALAFTVVFVRLAPPSRYFSPQPVGLHATSRAIAQHLRSPALLGLFATALLLMGSFVSLYNMLGFRLSAAPFNLPDAVVGAIFLMYLSGTVTAAVAGRIAERFGRSRVLLASEVVMLLGLVLTLPSDLPVVLVGVLLFTAGFFAAHAIASGWVGLLAREHRAEASSLYLFAYYLGSSVLGACAGLAFSGGGWGTEVAYIGAFLVVALVVAVLVARAARRTVR